MIPHELNTPEWQALALRLGYRGVEQMLTGRYAMVLCAEPTGWRVEWTRLYDGVSSDRRFLDRLLSLDAALAAINAAEDQGDDDDAAEAARRRFKRYPGGAPRPGGAGPAASSKASSTSSSLKTKSP